MSAINEYRARNFDPLAKAAAEREATRRNEYFGAKGATGPWRVEYRDDYNDSCVSGRYVVTAREA